MLAYFFMVGMERSTIVVERLDWIQEERSGAVKIEGCRGRAGVSVVLMYRYFRTLAATLKWS